MTCPACGESTVAFAVPTDLREYAPDGAAFATVCTVCLRTHAADSGEIDPEFDAVLSGFPPGQAGVALALALGKFGSLALNRAAIVALCEAVEEAGGDVLLTLDRLAVAGSVQAHFDVERRRHQLESYL